MKRDELLGQLSALQQMMLHLLGSLPEAECYRRHHPELPPLAWLFGRAAYLESYWVEEVVLQRPSKGSLVRDIFASQAALDESLSARLPDRDHLSNWALELQDDLLTLLANPATLPDHPLLVSGRLLPMIVRQRGALCEQMLWVLSERSLPLAPPFSASNTLQAAPPSRDHVDLHKGHYRIGARADDPLAGEDELPTNRVALDAFRIDRTAVNNGAYLSFIEADGYRERSLWSEPGWQWLSSHQRHPYHWRRDSLGQWYGLALGGPYELNGGDPLTGISYYEALAYANWVATLGGELAGAVVQHEYQWEVAARSGELTDRGRCWEWCANPYQLYSGYTPSIGSESHPADSTDGHISLRGGSIHSQKLQRRSASRHHASPISRYQFTGTRLVFPPSDMPWHQG